MPRLLDVLVVAGMLLIAFFTVRAFMTSDETAPAGDVPSAAETVPAPALPAAGTARQQQVPALNPQQDQEQQLRGYVEREAERHRQETARREAEARQWQEAQRPPDPSWGTGSLRVEPRITGREELETPREEKRESAADIKRREGRQKLQTVFRSLRSRGARFVTDAESYYKSCGGDTESYCGAQLQRLVAQALIIGALLDESREIARKSYLPAGEVRKLREQSGLEHRVWSDMERLAARLRR